MVDRYRRRVARTVIELSKDDPREGSDRAASQERRNRGGRSSLPRAPRRPVDQDCAGESSEGTTLSFGGSFTPFNSAISEAIFSRRSGRSSASVRTHRVISLATAPGVRASPKSSPIRRYSVISASVNRRALSERIMARRFSAIAIVYSACDAVKGPFFRSHNQSLRLTVQLAIAS